MKWDSKCQLFEKRSFNNIYSLLTVTTLNFTYYILYYILSVNSILSILYVGELYGYIFCLAPHNTIIFSRLHTIRRQESSQTYSLKPKHITQFNIFHPDFYSPHTVWSRRDLIIIVKRMNLRVFQMDHIVFLTFSNSTGRWNKFEIHNDILK